MHRMFAGLAVIALTAGLAQRGQASEKSATHRKPVAAKHELAPLSEQERALAMLNRFTFGPRPGDLAAVVKQGPDAWFEQQLDPDKIPNAAVDKRLADYPALSLSTPRMLASFPTQQLIRQVQQGKRPMPDDPALRAVYEVLLAKDEEKKSDQSPATQMTPAQTDGQRITQKKQDQAAAQALAASLLGQPRGERMTAILNMPVEQRIMLTGNLTQPQRDLLINDFNPRERELFYAMAGGPNAIAVIDAELQQARVLRAILSDRQLQEVMTDFWFNHFNVFLQKDSDRFYTPAYERDAIRAHALGKFRDLLMATAQHPAMLVYLDNFTSIGPDSVAAGRPRSNQKQQQRGLNENYGREVMELHTVGVNGGYTQADVTSLANILTGWTIDQPALGGGFVFDPKKHEPGTKNWFGQTIQENGYAEGQQALSWLASRPQTAHFICYKLAQRFVADAPPSTLVDRMAKTFLESDGDIKSVLRTMVHSSEFWSREYYRDKVKTPLEFVASAFRATDTNPSNPQAIVAVLKNMGEPLYQMLPPTGYPMTADHWMNSAALLDRLNFSLALSNGKVGNIKFDAPHLLASGLLARPAPAHNAHSLSVAVTAEPALGGQEEALLLMEQMLAGGELSARTNAVIRKQLAEPQQAPADPAQTLDIIAALVLGSPEFQMR
jgi:uncharacterized protein (DUF1800 family)